MSHQNPPEYWTIINIDRHDGTHYLLGVYKDLDAVYYRMKQMYLESGSELRIECHTLIDAETEAEDYNKLVVSRAKYKKAETENAIKEDKAKRFDEMLKSDEELEKHTLDHSLDFEHEDNT